MFMETQPVSSRPSECSSVAFIVLIAKLTCESGRVEPLQAARDQAGNAGVVHIVLRRISRQGMVEREGLSGLGGGGRRGRTSSMAAFEEVPCAPVRAADADLIGITIDLDAGG